MSQDVMDQPHGGRCPDCGALLRNPEDEYEWDADGVPRVVSGLGAHWCAACGWHGIPDP